MLYSAGRSKLYNFNPRAPRGARLSHTACIMLTAVFQSTCPARGTTPIFTKYCSVCYFNPRAPRGARRCLPPGTYHQRQISIHVPREGHDHPPKKCFCFHIDFNPRAPRGARLGGCSAHGKDSFISIHVPREGHDSKHAQFFRADLRKSYKYPAERDALPTKNVCKHIKTLG